MALGPESNGGDPEVPCTACQAVAQGGNLTQVNKEAHQRQKRSQQRLQSVTTVFALGRHNGKSPLSRAVTQSNVKHCHVKCNQSVSNVLAMHRVHCDYLAHVFRIHW